MNVFTHLRNWWKKPASEKRVVARSAFCDAGGVSQFDWLGDEEVQHRVAWDQIETVIAFKVDLYAYDQVEVVLVNERREVLVSVGEDSGSFGAFISDLPKWLRGCKQPEEWWTQAAFPAFKTNETVIFQRCHPPAAD